MVDVDVLDVGIALMEIFPKCLLDVVQDAALGVGVTLHDFGKTDKQTEHIGHERI